MRKKLIIDILMYADFIFLISYSTIRNISIHATAGALLFVLFAFHCYLNIWFYKGLFKGRYNLSRITLSIGVFGIFSSMVLMLFSSIFASGAVFEAWKFTQFWRTLHLFYASWGFLFMSFHLALHLQSKINELENRLKSKKLWVYGVYALIIVCGGFGLERTELHCYLFNISNWKMAAPSLFVSYLEYGAISAAICLLYHLSKKSKPFLADFIAFMRSFNQSLKTAVCLKCAKTPKESKIGKNLAMIAIIASVLFCYELEAKENQMINNGMIIRISEIEVHEQFLDEYLVFAKQVSHDSVLNESGVISIYPMQVLGDKTQIRILEIYKDELAYKSHIASAHFKKYKEGTLHMVKNLKLVDTKELAPENFKRIFKKAD